MSAALAVLPMIWATAQVKEVKEVTERKVVAPELAFYRKYTEALLRRYAHMSLEMGRVPSLLGKEMFRGKVTNYVVHGFDDVVIFVHDVEKCLAKLNTEQQQLIERIAVQEYGQGEAAVLLGLSLRTVVRRYPDALDKLTKIFLDRKLLDPAAACQAVEPVDYKVST
jgi:hypothetical protein